METSEKPSSGFPNSERLLSVNATVVNHWFQEMM